MPQAIEKTLNKVFIKDGRVIRSENWILWNGQDWPMIVIQRNGDFFKSHISDPEHGGSSMQGNLNEVLACLHSTIRKEYQELFALEDPTPQAIEKAGFKGYLIEQAV